MRVLGIETSCDETGIAVYDSARGLVADALYSQAEVHSAFGGVVPELASRDHVRKALPLVNRVLQTAGTRSLDGIAYTAGPGLIGALLAGASIANGLGWAWRIPVLGVHHLEAHLLAPMLEQRKPAFPFVALLVSGGHTMLVQVRNVGDYQVLGQSLDDAAGEAFDKIAKVLGLGYPGGPAIARLSARGDPDRFTFPRPMLNRPDLNFSFSGLKTFAINTIRSAPEDAQTRADIARAFEDSVIATLSTKCARALRQTGLSRLVVAGGVGANVRLRHELTDLEHRSGTEVFFPRPEFCTDNGAMIAYTGWLRFHSIGGQDTGINARARWPLSELTRINAVRD